MLYTYTTYIQLKLSYDNELIRRCIIHFFIMIMSLAKGGNFLESILYIEASRYVLTFVQGNESGDLVCPKTLSLTEFFI